MVALHGTLYLFFDIVSGLNLIPVGILATNSQSFTSRQSQVFCECSRALFLKFKSRRSVPLYSLFAKASPSLHTPSHTPCV